MRSLLTWKLISESLKQDIPVMLLYVLESSGSSPGRQGFSMAVNATAKMEGSLGGGIMEHKFVEMAKSRLSEQTREVSIHKQIHNKTAASHQSGMICSGEQTILLYRVQKNDAAAVGGIISSLDKNKTGLLVLSPAGITFKAGHINNTSSIFSQLSPTKWRYNEIIGCKNYLYIIGAGHCSLALSRIMRQMDFYILLFDDRHDLKTMDENDFAHEKKLLENYHELPAHIDFDSNDNYVVIMTFGYRTDAIVLGTLLNKKLKYLGMLGSKAKIKKMFEDLDADGYDSIALKRIHAPIGIAIKSQTPEEVAISIAAEIIKVKNA